MLNRLELANDFAKKIKSDDIKLIMLYGSVARGEDNSESDIDILIVSDNADDLRYKVNDLVVVRLFLLIWWLKNILIRLRI